MKRIFVALTLVTSTLLALVPSAQAARVMIAADDWIFTDAGFSSLLTDTANFALNVAEFVF